ncbi:MAG: InlB B-repeat-containing protein, partial [Clostridia bacterium]|nr:InlB B-repeat-containing protein [Clostridia bacterium]
MESFHPTAQAASTWDGQYLASGIQNNHIVNAAGFAYFVNNTGSFAAGTVVYLDTDVDMAGRSLNTNGVFTGIFDGQNHTISNANVACSANHSGLFDTTNSATLRNFVLVSPTIVCSSNQTALGMVGWARGGNTINNVHIIGGRIEGYTEVGAFIGEQEGSNTTVINCTNSASVVARDDHAGGIVGINMSTATNTASLTITQCMNTGSVQGRLYAGGIIGYGRDGTTTVVTKCANTGSVYCPKGDYAGGIAGRIHGSTIDSCYNKGNVSGSASYSGGIIGTGPSISNCYNVGDVQASVSANVLIGRWSSQSNSYYLSGISGGAAGTAVSAAQLKTLASSLGANYCTDTWNVNSGYPILKWWRDGFFRFPIRFMDGEETVKALATYNYGASIADPSQEKLGYLFDGWYTANEGGTLAAAAGNAYTAGVSIPTNTAALTRDAQGPYYRAGTVTLYARYSETVTDVTLDGNGADVAGTLSVNAPYGEPMPAYGAAPQKTGYTFAGYFDAQTEGTQYYNADGTSARNWDKNVSAFTLYAHWEANDDTPYTVKHYYMDTTGNYPADDNPDKTEIKYDTTGATLLHENLATTPPAGCAYNAAKSGTSSEIARDGSTVIKLYYAREKYTVVYKGLGDVVLDTQQVYHGADAAAPVLDEYKQYNDSQHYHFLGWSETSVNVTGNMTINARYVPEEHNWSEKNWTRTPTCTDGGEYSQTCTQCGKVKTVTPSSEGHSFRYSDNGNGTHTVTCAKCDYNLVTSHTYTDGICVCGAIQNVSVTFKDYKGEEIQTVTVPYNTVPIYTGGESRKLRPTTESTVYTFENWVEEDDPETAIGAVTADTVYVPLYVESARPYTVVFLNWNGDVLAEEEVGYGSSAEDIAPAATKEDGRHTYAFTGWSGDISNITKNTYVVAQFEATDVTNWTVTFTDGAGMTLYTTTVADGEGAVYPYADPEREGYTFYCWNKNYSRVTADLTVDALFIREYGDEYIASFVNYDNTFLEAYIVPAGGTAAYDGETPVRPTDELHVYIFSGWDKDLTDMQENTVFTAQYETQAHAHTYTFVPQKDPQCETVGVKAHYVCEECGTLFDEEYNKTSLFELAIPATNHPNKAFTQAAAATCVAEGNVAYWSCPDCGKLATDEAFTNVVEDVTTPVDLENGHRWAAITYSWSDDNSTVTATRACLLNAEHNVTETAETVYEIDVPAGQYTEGKGRYTATFTNPLFEEVSKTVAILSLYPDWYAPTYEWSEDHASCTATRVNKTDPSVTETETVDSVYGVVTPAACGAAGEAAYTATFENPVFAAQTHSVILEALTHSYSAPVYTWSDDHKTVTASMTCSNCGDVVTETVTAAETVITPATVEAEGESTFTAVFTNPAFETQTVTVPTEKLDPAWGETTYVWNEDHTECTATRVSTTDPTVSETETATATYEVTLSPTCHSKGLGVYTVTFANTGL